MGREATATQREEWLEITALRPWSENPDGGSVIDGLSSPAYGKKLLAGQLLIRVSRAGMFCKVTEH